VFANYFEGIRAPQVWGFSYVPDPENADVKFEKAGAIEAGTRYDGAAGLGGSLTFWRNDYSDFFTFDSGFYENLGKVRAEGVDVAATWQVGDVVGSLAGLTILASVTFQDTELRSGPNPGNDVPYAWDTKAAWRARYEFGSGWLASIGGTYVGGSYSDQANTAAENPEGNIGRNPSRVLWDAQVAKEWLVGKDGLLRAMVGATNLFDHEWYVHSRGGFFGGGKVAGPPRQAYVGLGYTLSF
jgi:outer membrane receptor protein involved in Fe transport